MFFRNLVIYNLAEAQKLLPALVNDQLGQFQMTACGATDAQSIGWVPPSSSGNLAHIVNGQVLLALGVEQKILPSSVINQFAKDKVAKIEEEEGRRVGRKEMREIKESVTLELLPRAFVRRRTTFGWIDPINGWVVIDTASSSKAEEFLEHLHKSVEGLPIRMLKPVQSPSSAMTGWVAGGDAPAGFTIDQDLNLNSAEHAQVRYVKHSLEGEDIRQQIASGKVATKLAMTWADRISFVLTETLQIKRLSFLDILKEQSETQAENEEERFDLDLTLMSGELAKMINDLVAALGGEQAPSV